MKWDSKAITGTINPGPNAIQLKMATLDPTNWTVHFEADAKNGEHIVIDGKLENIGSYNRTITGTWSEGSAKGDCKFTRD
jgi:predicted nucleotidyltransferase